LALYLPVMPLAGLLVLSFLTLSSYLIKFEVITMQQQFKKLLPLITLLAVSAPSFAALPTEATAAITSASTGISDTSAAMWAPIAAAAVAGLLFKLFKRFFSKI